MKILIALLIEIPTLIATLLFLVAGFAYNNPAMLAAESNPVIAILCIVAGVIAAIPLIVAIFIGIGSLTSSGKTKIKIRRKTPNGYIQESEILEPNVVVGASASQEAN